MGNTKRASQSGPMRSSPAIAEIQTGGAKRNVQTRRRYFRQVHAYREQSAGCVGVMEGTVLVWSRYRRVFAGLPA
jgi:hypothetical protein